MRQVNKCVRFSCQIFDRVIQKIKRWTHFFGTQCMYNFPGHDRANSVCNTLRAAYRQDRVLLVSSIAFTLQRSSRYWELVVGVSGMYWFVDWKSAPCLNTTHEPADMSDALDNWLQRGHCGHQVSHQTTLQYTCTHSTACLTARRVS